MPSTVVNMDAEEKSDFFDIINNEDGTTCVIMKNLQNDRDQSVKGPNKDDIEREYVGTSVLEKSHVVMTKGLCESLEDQDDENLCTEEEKNIFIVDVSICNVSPEDDIDNLLDCSKDKVNVEALLELISIKVYSSDQSLEGSKVNLGPPVRKDDVKNGAWYPECTQLIHITDENEDQLQPATAPSGLPENELRINTPPYSAIEEMSVRFPEQPFENTVPIVTEENCVDSTNDQNIGVQLDNHYHGDLLYQCGSCCQTFRSELSCNRHMRMQTCTKNSKHGRLKLQSSRIPRKCRHCRRLKCKCDVPFKEDTEIQGHFPCEFCSMKFQTRTTLARHMRTHRTSPTVQALSVNASIKENPEEFDVCSTCEQTACTCKTMNNIERCQTCKQNICRCDDPDSEFLEFVEKEDEIFKCDKCDMTFKTRSTLARHVKNHSNTEDMHISPSPNRTVDKDVKTVRNIANGEGKASKTKKIDQKNEHVNEMLGKIQENGQVEKSASGFFCTYCGKMCQYESILEMHMRVFHPNEGQQESDRQHTCTQCQTTFRLAGELKVHRCRQEVPKSFVCYMCKQAYETAKQLAEHVKTHGKPKQLECPHCGKVFARKYLQLKHIRLTHRNRDRLPDKSALYNCAQCGAGFTQRGLLVHHLNTHH